MEVWICVKNNRVCKKGTFFVGNRDDGLKRLIVTKGPRGTGKLRLASPFIIPWAILGRYLVPVGRRALDPFKYVAEEDKAIEDFQRDNEEIIEEELKRRQREYEDRTKKR